MNDFKTGKIISISEVQTFDSGAKKLTFQIDTGSQYDNKISFDLFKGVDHLQHIDNFIKFNKVGDEVNVEYITSSRESKGIWYTSLKMWRCEKVSSDIPKEIQSTPSDFDDLSF